MNEKPVNAKVKLRRCRKGQTNLLSAHLFVVFDLILRDDTVRLLGLLPGELDAALLHLLLDDLADLGWSCAEKKVSVSARQTSQPSRGSV